MISSCGPGRARDLLAGTDQIDVALFTVAPGRVDSSQILRIRDKHSVNNFLQTLLAPQTPTYPGTWVGKVHFRRVRVHSSLILADLYVQDTIQELIFEHKGKRYAWPLSADTRDYLRLAFSYPMFFPYNDPFDNSPIDQ